MFSDSPDKILGLNIENFWNGFGQSRTEIRFGFNPKTCETLENPRFWIKGKIVISAEKLKCF